MMDYAEKREYHRMVMNCSMEYQQGNNAKPCQGKIINLSGTGVLFIASDEIEVGASMSFKLTPENSLTPPMSADIQVTRCEQLSENEYQVAAEIVQIR